jgi:hypothetical protein
MVKPSGKAVCNTSKKIDPIVDGMSVTCKGKFTLLKSSVWMDGSIMKFADRFPTTCRHMALTAEEPG